MVKGVLFLWVLYKGSVLNLGLSHPAFRLRIKGYVGLVFRYFCHGKLGIMTEHNTQKDQSFKESLEELYGQPVSEQEAFAAQYDLAELLRVLDEVDRALPRKDVHGQPERDGSS